jgi:methylglutaconyl-CoA hydratase
MSHILFEVGDRGIARLRLNRPEVRNAFNDQLIAEITEAVSDVPEDARVLVISGEGKVFSAGADLEWMRSMAGLSHEENVADSAALRDMLAALDNCRVPVVGKIHGAAIAGAAGIAACCDYVVAAEGAIFAFTEVRLGLVPAVISPFVVRKVGYSFARAMFLTAERFDARRALEAGLVHRVVPEDELDEAVDEVVDALLQGGPEALRHSGKLLDLVAGRTPEEVGDLTVETIAERRVSDEGQEGIAAFLEKRRPRWSPED